MEALTFRNMNMPKLGLGTWPMRGAQCQAAVESALAIGYRHIDTAEMYDNEDAVGAAVKASGLSRAEIFLTTKVWVDHLTPAALMRSLDTSLKKLGTDYADLYLIHWPSPTMNLSETLGTMMALQQSGRIKAIGVANFPVALLRMAIEDIGAPIACDQVEYHVYLDQSPLLAYSRRKGFAVTAYAPLAKGRLAADKVLDQIGTKHGVTAAQVALAWLIQQPGVAAIPKSSRKNIQQANFGALSIRLDSSDMAAIAALPKSRRFVNPSFAPEW